ncbi:MAG: hypothetical protein BWY87_00533 [Deltaproteobacteria bacterium ADurb.Bin510]|nr:MAG: hypothetical protein BWY87_00533 [Deltaproteobacteria bacterium ADurb.Bin510]
MMISLISLRVSVLRPMSAESGIHFRRMAANSLSGMASMAFWMELYSSGYLRLMPMVTSKMKAVLPTTLSRAAVLSCIKYEATARLSTKASISPVASLRRPVFTSATGITSKPLIRA